jgi:phosphoribosylaminoimidazole (AIR) synthetase
MGNLTYRDAGVNNDAQDHFADSIGTMARRTVGPEVLAGIGGFAASVAPALRRHAGPRLGRPPHGARAERVFA